MIDFLLHLPPFTVVNFVLIELPLKYSVSNYQLQTRVIFIDFSWFVLNFLKKNISDEEQNCDHVVSRCDSAVQARSGRWWSVYFYVHFVAHHWNCYCRPIEVLTNYKDSPCERLLSGWEGDEMETEVVLTGWAQSCLIPPPPAAAGRPLPIRRRGEIHN